MIFVAKFRLDIQLELQTNTVEMGKLTGLSNSYSSQKSDIGTVVKLGNSIPPTKMYNET